VTRVLCIESYVITTDSRLDMSRDIEGVVRV
jgi:hypothetical protein